MAEISGRIWVRVIARWALALGFLSGLVVLTVFRPKVAGCLAALTLAVMVVSKVVGDLMWAGETGPDSTSAPVDDK